VLSLNGPNKFFKYVNGIVLGVVEIIFLSVNSKPLDLIIGLGLKNDNFARHIERLHPFL